MKQDGHDTYQEYTATFFCICSAGFVERGHLRPGGLSFRRRLLASSLPVAGSTVSTVGMDPLFRRLRGVLSDASGPKGSFRSKQAG